jgi:hypothetical protein
MSSTFALAVDAVLTSPITNEFDDSLLASDFGRRGRPDDDVHTLASHNNLSPPILLSRSKGVVVPCPTVFLAYIFAAACVKDSWTPIFVVPNLTQSVSLLVRSTSFFLALILLLTTNSSHRGSAPPTNLIVSQSCITPPTPASSSQLNKNPTVNIILRNHVNLRVFTMSSQLLSTWELPGP